MVQLNLFPRNSAHPAEPKALDRRKFMMSAAVATGGFGAMVKSKDVMAIAPQDEAGSDGLVQQSVSEHARPISHPPQVHSLPRWIPDHTGPYDLSQPYDNHFAWAKVQANLAGEYSWLANYGWVLLAPPGEPAFPFLGSITLMQYFVTPADEELVPDAGPLDYVLWATATTTYADPRTFDPISKIMNPYTGRMMEPPVMNYADRLAFRFEKSILVPGVDPAFYEQPWDRDGGFSQHFIDADDDIAYTVLGSAQAPGPMQPRVDTAHWTAKRADIMNPSLRSIDCRRDISAVMKASEYSWYDIPKGDPTQIIMHLGGLKTQKLARIPDVVKSLTVDAQPGRFVI